MRIIEEKSDIRKRITFRDVRDFTGKEFVTYLYMRARRTIKYRLGSLM